jgi:hypothetical protein
MSLSVEDIVKEAMSKGSTASIEKKPESSDATKLAHELESLALESEKEAEAFAESERARSEKQEQIKEFIDTLSEVL